MGSASNLCEGFRIYPNKSKIYFWGWACQNRILPFRVRYGVGHAKPVACPISLYQCFTLGLKAFHHIERLFESQGTGSIFLQRTQKNLHLQALAIQNFSGNVSGIPPIYKKMETCISEFAFSLSPEKPSVCRPKISHVLGPTIAIKRPPSTKKMEG